MSSTQSTYAEGLCKKIVEVHITTPEDILRVCRIARANGGTVDIPKVLRITMRIEEPYDFINYEDLMEALKRYVVDIIK